MSSRPLRNSCQCSMLALQHARLTSTHAVGGAQRHAANRATAEVLGDLTDEADLLAALFKIHIDRVVDLGEIGLGELGVEGGADDLENGAGRSHG